MLLRRSFHSGLGTALRGRRPREIGFVSVLPNPPTPSFGWSRQRQKNKSFNTESTEGTEKSGEIRVARVCYAASL
jgi:hypothetical protein